MPYHTDYVLWDWNGTLMDDVDHTLGCLNWLLEQNGYPQRYALDSYREIFDFPIEGYYRRAGFDFGRTPFAALARAFMDHYNAGVDGCSAASGAQEVLGRLQRSGVHQLILSASQRGYLAQQVAYRGLDGYFDQLVGLGDIYGTSKVQAGLEWLHATGADPARCVMVGDTTHDAAVARALGARCVLCATGHQSRARLEQCGCAVIDRLQELPALL